MGKRSGRNAFGMAEGRKRSLPQGQWPPGVEELEQRGQLRWRFEQWEAKAAELEKKRAA